MFCRRQTKEIIAQRQYVIKINLLFIICIACKLKQLTGKMLSINLYLPRLTRSGHWKTLIYHCMGPGKDHLTQATPIYCPVFASWISLWDGLVCVSV